MKNFKKLVLTLMLVAAMSAMYVVSAFAATGIFYVSKDGGATYEKAPFHAQQTIADVNLQNGQYKIIFKKVNWMVAKGEVTEFNGKGVSYKGRTSYPITSDYLVKSFALNDGGTITGTPVQFKVHAIRFGKEYNHAYDKAVLVIR